jgi:hypothetical protein
VEELEVIIDIPAYAKLDEDKGSSLAIKCLSVWTAYLDKVIMFDWLSWTNLLVISYTWICDLGKTIFPTLSFWMMSM